MQKFSSWINNTFVENANPAQLIGAIQKNLANAQADITKKNGLLQNLQNLAKSNPVALSQPQLAQALQLAMQKNDFRNLEAQLAQLEKQKPQPQQQQPQPQQQQQQPNAQQNPQAVPAPAATASQPQRKQ